MSERENEHEFLVLGDLGDGRFIVRMFVGDRTFDQEFAASLDELPALVDARMAELAAAPDEELLADAERPLVHPGHAVALPEQP